MGRASKRKKAQRQAGRSSRQARQNSPADAATDYLADGLGALIQEARKRVEREAAALPAWYGDAEPVSAETPPWPEGSLGHRFLTGTYLGEALDAPSLLTAQVPNAAAFAADSTHWRIATTVLIRAVIFDGLTLDHPAVSTLLEVLAPIAEAELAHGQAFDTGQYKTGTDPEFPELDGPVYTLGARALVEAAWAAVGEDPLSEVLGVLHPALDGTVPGLDGQAVAEALIGAFAAHYRRPEQPGDADVLARIGPVGGNALENLAAAAPVPPQDILPAGLTLLSALAQLCLTDAPSILQQPA